MNGFVPNLTGGGPGASGPSLLERGFVTYGSDSGHQAAFGGPRGGAHRGGGPPGANLSDDWALNDEAIRNLGYMQMKKTHDAAMVIIERAYGARPRFNYYIGTSQGGREALTVAQRYPADRGAALSRRLRRCRRQCTDRELLDADAGAGVDSHPREAVSQLGHGGKGQRVVGRHECELAGEQPRHGQTRKYPDQ